MAVKQCLFGAVCALTAFSAQGFTLYEPFNYPAGVVLIGQTNSNGSVWLPAGPGGSPPKVRPGGLPFSSWAVPQGNLVEAVAAVGPSARLTLGVSVTKDPLFFSFVLRVVDVSGLVGDGGAQCGLSPVDTPQAVTPDLLGARVFVRPTDGGYQVGLTKTSAATAEVVWASQLLPLGENVLIVGSYEFAGASLSGDRARLWVYRDKTALPPQEAPVTVTSSTAGPDLPRIASFVLLQKPAPEQAALLLLDELRLATNWAQVATVADTEPRALWDFGDAPPAYGVWFADNGARHRLSGLFLGARVDAEADGQSSPHCNGDDGNGTPNDEDGVALLTPMAIGRPAVFQVVSSGAGFLSAWFDFDGDGRWQPGERVFHGEPLVAGTNRLSFVAPATARPGFVITRWRLASDRVDDPNGPAADGEVQDMRFMIRGEKLLPRLTADRAPGAPRIHWNQRDSLLEEADTVAGPWRPVRGALTGFAPTNGQPQKFYRLRAQPDADDIGGLLRRAELVFDGVVTSVQYRNSDVNSDQTNSLPFTFVTFAVNEVFKGQLQGTNFCLRLIGGSDGQGNILKVGGVVDFDVGQRGVILVNGNGRLVNPLVGQERGRFRLVNGAMCTNRGREVHWRPDGTLGFGPRRNLEEVLFQALHGAPRPPFTPAVDDDGVASADPPGEHLDQTRFRAVLQALLEQGHTPEELQGAGPIASCDIRESFYAPQFNPKKSRAPGGQ